MRIMTPAVLAALALSACSLPPPTPGSSYVTMNGRRVVPLQTPGTFEVIASPGDAGPQYFCAAADYAERMLGARPSDRVVIIRTDGDSQSSPGTRGVSFTVMSREEAPPLDGIYLNPRKLGEATTVANGKQSCMRQQLEIDWN
ncbi:hypothetical protein [Mangrovicoccus ximenensis]|uniref:hypothetical protein n=1 Tax=Mangrovicoccus ximenensis TaxID=1911570 RepID=UPI000D36B610|nr:hypothetical protein [Mangrovicoccus ximenensis]